MEGFGILKKNPVNIAHLPTLLLAIGYPVYWLELYGLDSRRGTTSPLAAGLFIFFLVFVLVREREAIAGVVRDFKTWFLKSDAVTRLFCSIALALIVMILGCSLYAALLPPHLMQESDAMSYHYSLPRQHLIAGNFDRISWSGFDLYFLPVDFALAPYWFLTALPNKFPQFIFLVGLVLITCSLAQERKNGWPVAIVAAALVCGSHSHGIQMGTAMLDLINAYLFLAALDSFSKRMRWLFIIEANFYLWSKSFMAVQTLAVIAGIALVFLFLKRTGFKDVLWGFESVWSQAERREGLKFLHGCLPGFLALALFVAGPFVAKSMAYAGTPFYPLAAGTFAHTQAPEGSEAWAFIKKVSDDVVGSVPNNYGHGRSIIDFLKHFWLIAVPEKGVNNAFDYPLGLTYLLAFGPFLVFTIAALRKKQIPLLALIVVVMWTVWWCGSQQSRWLYAPLTLMFVLVAGRIAKPSKILWAALLIALLTNGASVVRAHKADFGRPASAVLREQDRKLVAIGDEYITSGRSGTVETAEFEVAFARFPVAVRKESLPNPAGF